MHSLRLKFGERRSDWRCCFCCHVRTGTIFYGVWNLMLHIMALSVMAILFNYHKPDLDPVLPTPLSEVDNINIEVSGSSVEVTLNDRSSIKPQPLMPPNYRDFWDYKALTDEDMNIGVVVTFCTFAMTLLLLYGAIKGKPTYLIPFFCLQVFDFCIGSISAVGYLCYPPDVNQLVMQTHHIPLQEELMKLSPHALGLFVAITFFLVLSVKAYFIGVVWSCYRYLIWKQTSVQRTVQFIDPDIQNLLPDLPDYETAVKKFPTPPPSYSNVMLKQYQYPVVFGANLTADNNNPTSTQTVHVPTLSAATAPTQEFQAQGRVNNLQHV